MEWRFAWSELYCSCWSTDAPCRRKMQRRMPPRFRRRIAYVRIGLELTRKINEARELMDRYKKSKDKEAAERMRVLWKELEPIAREKENYIYLHEFINIRNSLHPEPMKDGAW